MIRIDSRGCKSLDKFSQEDPEEDGRCPHTESEWEVREMDDGTNAWWCTECEKWIMSGGEPKDLLELNSEDSSSVIIEEDDSETEGELFL